MTTRLVQRTLDGTRMENQCHCGKICKNVRGLKIHQARSRCRPNLSSECTAHAGKTREDPSQESNHRAENLPPETLQGIRPANELQPHYRSDEEHPLGQEHQDQDAPIPESTTGRERTPQLPRYDTHQQPEERRERIKWPGTNKKEWSEFDEDLDIILNTSLKGDAFQKVKTLGVLIYAMGKDRFGVKGKSAPKANPMHPNRREKEIKKIRKELRELRKRYRKAESDDEKRALSVLRDVLRERLAILRKAENARRKAREKAKRREEFIKDPFRFTSDLLGGEKSGSLTASQDEVEGHLRLTHSDQNRNEPLGDLQNLEDAEEPKEALKLSEPTWKETQEVVRKARGASAPGPNGVQYKVYKNCPLILRHLWRLLKAVWKKGKIPEEWKFAEGCFTPKEKSASRLDQFRTISLLNVEGKIFFSIFAKRLTRYAIENGYIDPSIQKGGIPGFSGCVEHTSAVSQLVREAKRNRSDLTVVWLDLANAYGSIPHSLIKAALHHFHVPDRFIELLESYLDGMHIRFTTRSYTTNWQIVEKGIITGCTISVTLFVLGMNLIINACKKEAKGPMAESGIRLPNTRGFMDDLTITVEKPVQARWMMEALGSAATWARMSFKPKKSRSLSIVKGKLSNRFRFKVQGEPIPTIQESPIKCLGKWFDASLKDTRNIEAVKNWSKQMLAKIDKTGLPGKFKAWIFQNGMLPRLMWPLQMYETTLSLVENLERTINRSLRRWLGLPPCLSSNNLYSVSSKLQLPLTSLVEEYKVCKTRLVLMLRDSQDEKINRAGIQVLTGRKWSALKAVEEAESSLRLKDIVGTTTVGRLGLGATVRERWDTAKRLERRKMVLSEVRTHEEEQRRGKVAQMGAQGAWTRWETSHRKLSWKDMWQMRHTELNFLLRSVYDVLPTPTNLARWGLRDDHTCPLCSQPGSLLHILTACKEALSQGRYRWRHDQVLREICSVIEAERKKKHTALKKGVGINFVRAGEKPCQNTKESEQTHGLLHTANDWKMSADLQKRLRFPPIVETQLRPDIVIWSEKEKKIAVVELTVPWEERCEASHELKKAKYEELLLECRRKGWSTWNLPVEIGCRGFPAPSMGKTLRILGIQGKARKKASRDIAEAAQRASCWLWLKRGDVEWKPTAGGQ